MAVIASVVLGIAFLLTLYKTIDGDFPVGPGIATLCVIVFLELNCVKPVHPVIPGLILLVVVLVMAMFPYAATQLEAAETRALETEQLEKAYSALVARPDNVPALFEVARRLHAHGLKGHAVGLATKTLQALDQSADPVSNRSLRHQFRNEEYAMKRWIKEIAQDPRSGRPVACPHCGHVNSLDVIVCEKCKEAYVLTLARSLDVRSRFIGRLLLAAAAVAGVIVGGAAIGLYFQGTTAILAFVAALTTAGVFISALFRPPKFARS